MPARLPSPDRLRSYFENQIDAVFVLDRNWYFTYLNPHAQQQFGRGSNLVGRVFWDVLPEAKESRTFARFYQALSEDAFVEFETYSKRFGAWFEVRATPWEGGLVVTFRDTSVRNKADFSRREASERWRLATETAELGVWDANLITGEMQWSPKFLSMVGLEANTNPRAERFAALLEPEDRLDFESLFRSLLTGEVRDRLRAVYRITRPGEGEPRWLLMLGMVLLDQASKPSRMIGTVQDITEMRQSEERARYASFQDVLTGLPDRNLFLKQVQTLIDKAAGSGASVALVVFDIDEFRELTETLGRDAGDDLLAAVGQKVGTLLADGSIASRIGTDEFAVALPSLGPLDDLPERAGRLLDRLSEPLQVADRQLDLKSTAGMVFYPADGLDPHQLIKSAEVALHVAKASGEARMNYVPSMRQPVIARVHQELLARQALTDDRILPFYQPKIVLRTGKAAGFEALLRWMDPAKGLQTPDTLFAAFNHPGLASDLGRRMLDRVLTDVRQWMDNGVPFGHVALNLSQIELKRADFVDHFLGRINAFGVVLDAIQVEVTEPILLGKDAYPVGVALRALRAEGVKVALDDFGVGFTSLTMLREHPIDVLKIDRSFTRELGRNKDALAVARAAIKLGQDLGKTVVAVGLATPDQRDLVAACGCDIGQGFMLGRPMAAHQVPEFLAETKLDA